MGSSGPPTGIGLAMHTSGLPLIVFQQVTQAPGKAVLKMASQHPVLPGYGPEFDYYYWEVEMVDGAGAYTDEGQWAAIDAHPTGLATVAYYETDSDHATGRLKVARQRFQVTLPLVWRDFSG